jgi:hypothetical protein
MICVFVALCFTDLLYLPKRPIAKAFANASWQQQRHAIENLVTLRKQGWKGFNLKAYRLNLVWDQSPMVALCASG